MTSKVAAVIDTSLSNLLEQSSEYVDGQRIIDISIYEMLRYLQRIKDTFLTVGESKDDLFTLQSEMVRGFSLWTIKGTTVGRQLLRMLSPNEYSEKIKEDQEHEFSPEVRLWFKFLHKYGLDSVDRNDWSTHQADLAQSLFVRLGKLVADIRAEVSREGFRDWQNRKTKLTKKNTSSIQRWLDRIFERHANLLVIRIDLSYKKDYQNLDGDLHAISISEAFEHRERFLRSLPKLVIKDSLLGYCVKSEYTLRKSIHHHVVVIVDASKLISDAILIDILGKYWRDQITLGRGDWFNANAKWSKDNPYSGVGRVDVSDADKVLNLRHRVLPYLVKPDYQARWIIPKKHRLFVKSIAQPLTGKKPGRPRISKGIKNEQSN